MKKALAFLFLSSILLRLWFSIGYWAEKPLTHDAKEYLELAENYNETGRFLYDAPETSQIEQYGRAPGYPFWLALLLRINSSLGWIRLAEVSVSLISCYVFFLLGRELFNVRSGLIAFNISSFYLPFIWLIPTILSENLWIMVMLTSYWWLLRVRHRRNSFVEALVSIVLLALASLIRPATVFLLPLYMIWVFRYSDWKRAVIVALVYFAALAPWNLYLYRQEGRFIFVASEGGVTFWTGTHPQYSGEGDLSVNPPVQKAYRELLKQRASDTPTQREKLYFQLALQNIFQHPFRYVAIEVKKLFFWILPIGPSVLQTSLLHRVSGICFYVPLLILSTMAIRSVPKGIRFFSLGVIASFTVMILLFFPQERFRIATVDPILVLLASYELNRRFGVTLARK